MCFPIAAIGAIFIWIIIAAGIIAILWACVAFLGPRFGWPADIIAFLIKICTIIFWVIVGVAVVTIIIDVIGCLIGMAPTLNLHGK